MDLGRPTKTTEARALIGMVQYCRDMWPRRSHVLSPPTEAASGPKYRKILCNDALESSLKELKWMVSADTLLRLYILETTIHGSHHVVISQNNKPIVFFYRKLIKPQRNYTKTEKKLLAIVECLKQFPGIIFDYEINVFSYHNNLVYAATLIESQSVIQWRLIIKEFGPKVQHIAGFDNIIADTLSRLPSTPSDNNEPCTRKDQCRGNKLFAIGREENTDNCFPLKLLIVQREKQKEQKNIKSSLNTYISDQASGYCKQELDDVEIICYDSKIYVPKSLCIRVLDWYHFYLNPPGGSRLAKKPGMCVIGKALSHKRSCSLICARNVNSSKRERLFMEIFHLII